jgi:hypothetical protein
MFRKKIHGKRKDAESVIRFSACAPGRQAETGGTEMRRRQPCRTEHSTGNGRTRKWRSFDSGQKNQKTEMFLGIDGRNIKRRRLLPRTQQHTGGRKCSREK